MTPKHAKVERNQQIAERRANGELLKVLCADYGLAASVIRKIARRWSKPVQPRRTTVASARSEIDEHLARLLRETRDEMQRTPTCNNIPDDGAYG